MIFKSPITNVTDQFIRQLFAQIGMGHICSKLYNLNSRKYDLDQNKHDTNVNLHSL